MPEPSQTPEEAFLRAFFSPPNAAVLAADGSAWTILGTTAHAAQTELLNQNCSRAKSRSPALLPWIQNNATTWYAVAFAPVQVRVLQQWLRAFIGRTFGAFSELPITLRSGNDAEHLLRSLGPSAVFSIRAVGAERKHVGDQLARLLRLLTERPGLALESWDTASSLLRSFFATLAAGNLHAAAVALSRLKSGAFLDAVNLAFLDIQFLAAADEWGAIASPERLKDILLLRRPLRIDSLIATALYRSHLAGKEADSADLLATFRATVLPLAGSIFSRQPLGDFPDALRCYLLWRLSSTNDLALIKSAASDLKVEDPVRRFAEQQLAALAETATALASKLTIENARTCFDAGDWQGVIQTTPQLPPSSEALGFAIRAAAEVGTAAAAQIAFSEWSRHTPAQQAVVLRSRWLENLWKTVSALRDERAPSFTPPTPGAWFSRFSISADWPQAQAAWDRAVGEWDFGAFANSPQQVRAATDLLARPPAETRTILRQTLSQLLAQIPEDLRASRSLQKLHLHAAEFLATTEALSEDERELMVEASVRTLDAGLPKEEYSYLVEQCFTDAWQRAASPRTFPWALSLLETLTDRPANPPAVRADFAQLIFADAQRYTSRLDPNQVFLLRELLKVLGLNDLSNVLPQNLAPQVQAAEAQQLAASGIRRLGIYTLMEPAARRAKAIIEAAHPAIEVIVNADHVATTALRNMARDSDAILVATASAKHAATTCIEQNRRGQPLIYVNGKGSSSIITGWESLLENLRTS